MTWSDVNLPNLWMMAFHITRDSAVTLLRDVTMIALNESSVVQVVIG